MSSPKSPLDELRIERRPETAIPIQAVADRRGRGGFAFVGRGGLVALAGGRG